MTNQSAMIGLTHYLQRMKIKEAFRDLKSLLNFHKLMNKHRTQMEKMVAFLQIAYAIVLILGEALRNHLFLEGSRKQPMFSGPFLFLKLKPYFSPPVLSLSRSTFFQILFPVRTLV